MDKLLIEVLERYLSRDKTTDNYLSAALREYWSLMRHNSDDFLHVVSDFLNEIGVENINFLEHAVYIRSDELIDAFFSNYLNGDDKKIRTTRYLNNAIKHLYNRTENTAFDCISMADIEYSGQLAKNFFHIETKDKLNSPFDIEVSLNNPTSDENECIAEKNDIEHLNQVELIDEEYDEVDADDLVKPVAEFTTDFNIDDNGFDHTDLTDDFFFIDIDELLENVTDSADAYFFLEKDRISFEERALQIAAGFIDEVDLDKSDLPLLKEIFYINILGWGQTRAALKREFDKGLTSEELYLAHQLRRVWALNDRFWRSYKRNGSFENIFYSLPWSIACLVAKAFDSIPCYEEIEVILSDIYLIWLKDKNMRFRFNSFSLYLAAHFFELEENWHLYHF